MVRSVLASQRVGLLLHGGASGVDAAAAAWARAAGVEARAFPADWSGGRSAGPARNRRMLREGQPDVLLAFPGGRGTDDCVRAAGELGVPVRDLRDADPYALAEREAIQSVEREEAAWAKLGQRRAS